MSKWDRAFYQLWVEFADVALTVVWHVEWALRTYYPTVGSDAWHDLQHERHRRSALMLLDLDMMSETLRYW